MNYGILQRPSSSWQPMIETAKEVTVIVNGKQVGEPMRLLHGNKVSAATAMSTPFFLAAGDKPLHNIVDKATSFSCSLNKGVDGLDRILRALPIRSIPPKLYACENDHGALAKLALNLAGRVTVIPCLVDRICSERKIHKNGIVEVLTEPWQGQIVVLPALVSCETKCTHDGQDLSDTRMSIDSGFSRFRINSSSSISDPSLFTMTGSPSLPFAGRTVVSTETDEQGRYFSRRKLLLVNGTHTTLAFITLIKELKENRLYSRKSLPLPGKFKLLDYETADSANRKLIWAWTVARCSIIASEFSEDVLTRAHRTRSVHEALEELLDYAWTTLQRFSNVPDTTGRVLSGGVIKRFDGRLKSVLDKLTENNSGKIYPGILEVASKREIHRPSLTASYVRSAVEHLVRHASPIREEMTLRNIEKESTPKVISIFYRTWSLGKSWLRKNVFGI
eukprot:jgi/Bigna1/139361/aug1.50_g14069